MISPWTIYLMTRANSIGAASGIIALIAGILSIIGIIALAASLDYTEDKVPKFISKGLKVSVCSFLASLFINIATPTTKEIAAIYVIPKIVNNEKIQNCASDLVELANEWMNELKPKRRNQKIQKATTNNEKDT